MIFLTRQARLIAGCLLGLYLAWLGVGIFPVSPLEGDEQGVINGATAMSRGETDYLGLAYLPEIQPGSYVLLSHASRWSGIPVETLFAAGTVAGAGLFAWFAGRLLAHVLHLPCWIALAGLLWCQEIPAAFYYLNTTALGMWLTFAALLLACRPPTWRTCTGMIFCLAMAGWIRIDCLLPAPAVPVLLFGACGNLRSTLRTTGLTAVGSLALVVSLYCAAGISWADLSTTYAGRGGTEGWGPTLLALPLLLSPLICVLMTAGLAALVLNRQWRLLALIAAGCAATMPVYGTSLASTKYFYHLVPFMLIPAFFAGRLLLNAVMGAPRPRRLLATLALSLAALADQTFALQTSTPEFRRYAPEPVVATLGQLRGHKRPIRLVLGAGEVIPTTDGFRLRGGALFAPWIWHREKAAMQSQLVRFGAILDQSPEVAVFYSGWLPYQMTVRTLRANGYAFHGRPLANNSLAYPGEWTRDGHRVLIDYLPYRTSLYFDPTRHPANRTGINTYFLGDLSGVQPITELADSGEWKPLWPEYLWNFITCYQRHPPRADP